MITIHECSAGKLIFKSGGTSGVYFLKLGGHIVYIGKSINVFSRIYSSHTIDKKFDEVEIHWMPANAMLRYEQEQIQTHKPALNDWNNTRKVMNTKARLF